MIKKMFDVVLTMISDIKNDCSVSAIITGLIAVAVSYAGPLLVVFQAAKAANLGYEYLSSWIWAISFASGITGIILSIWFKAPIITAWSTPGAVLLVSGWSAYQYSDAIGAFLFSALVITIFGVSGLFSTVMKKIPYSIITAMLAGILLKFGVDVFVSLKQLPILVLPMIVVYLISKRCIPRYAVVNTLIIGIVAAFCLHKLNLNEINISLVHPVFTMPTFSLKAIIGIGIPLCIVTMASQNATGIGVLKADGYDTPVSPLISVTGIASILSAPFGSHGINLAAITAAICTGRESHNDPEKRYIAGISCGTFYIIFGTLGATVASVFSAFPSELIAVIAGVALFASISSSLSSAMSENSQKESALITFLVSISGITIGGIGAAFWGLVAGIITNFILTGEIRKIFKKRLTNNSQVDLED